MIRLTHAIRFCRVLALAQLSVLFWLPVVAAVVTAPTVAVAVAPKTMEAAIALHDAGRDGDEEATRSAVAAFEVLRGEDPDNERVIAYLGSSYAIQARDSGSVTDKIRFTNRGLRYLDRAVELAPEDFVVRLIRANVATNLPAMFGRTDSAVEDMLILHRMFTNDRAPETAASMVGIYTLLEDMAPDKGDWPANAAEAKALAAEN